MHDYLKTNEHIDLKLNILLKSMIVFCMNVKLFKKDFPKNFYKFFTDFFVQKSHLLLPHKGSFVFMKKNRDFHVRTLKMV